MANPKGKSVRRFPRYKEPILSVEECRKLVNNANAYLMRRGPIESFNSHMKTLIEELEEIEKIEAPKRGGRKMLDD